MAHLLLPNVGVVEQPSFRVLLPGGLLEAGSASAALTDVDTDEIILTGQTGIAYTGTGLGTADAFRITTGTKYVDGTSLTASTSLSGLVNGPTLAAFLTAGTRFGTCTFAVRASGVDLGTLAGTINPESGWQVHNVSDISQAADTGCIYNGQSPAVAVGDQVLFESNGTNVTIDSQGFVVLDGVTDFNYYVWDATDETWGTMGTFYAAGAAVFNIWEWIENAQGGSAARAQTVMAYLVAQGYTNQGINSGLFNWLGGLGYSGGLTTRITNFERDNTDRYN